MLKKKTIITTSIWFFISASIRILFYLFDYTGVSDSYGFFDSALLKLELGDSVLSSGMAFAYTNALAKFISVFGSNINLVFGLQLIFEMLALLFIFLGSVFFWDFWTAVISCSILSVSPLLLELLKVCSTEEYFLYYFSIVFLALSIFSKYSRSHKWTRCTRNEIIVLSIGILSGMLIVWNYNGIICFGLMIIILIRNFAIFMDRGEIQELVDGEDLEEEKQVMSVFSQFILLVFGISIGMFFTLLKYTGYSGLVVIEQFDWWRSLFSTLPGRTMDIDSTLSILLISFLIISELLSILVKLKNSRSENKLLIKEFESDSKIDTNELPQKKQGESDEFFITEDGRKVRFLENPLKGPKKSKHTNPGFDDLKFDLDELLIKNEEFILPEEKNIISQINNFHKDNKQEKKGGQKQAHAYDKRVSFAPNVIFGLNSSGFDVDVDDDDDFDV